MKWFKKISVNALRVGLMLIAVAALGSALVSTASADLAPCASATGGISGTGPGQSINGTIGATNYSLWAGVIYLDLTGTPNDIQAFCIDMTHHAGVGDCFNTGAALTGNLAKAIYYYPPDKTLSNDENAARQAAVWHYSDGFAPTSPQAVVDRYNAIVADIDAQPAPPSAHPPVMTVNPLIAEHKPGESQTFTLTVTKDSLPVVGQVINLSLTGVGSLSAPSVATDANGEATFSVTSSVEGASVVNANFSYSLPIGTQFDPVAAGKQKLVLGETTTGNVNVDPMVNWRAPNAVTLAAFHLRAKGKRVELQWETGTELQMLGFNVWRKTGKNAWKKINADLITATNAGMAAGAQYKFSDKAVKAGKKYSYKIEMVGANQVSEWSAVQSIKLPAK